MIKRLIFDVDNTLITNVDFAESIKNTLIDLDIYNDERLVNFVKGISEYESIYNNYNKDDYTKFISNHINFQLDNNFLDVFFKNLKYAIPKRNERLINTISKLALEYELVLLTNFFKDSQMNRLNGMGIGKYFVNCYGEKMIKPNKKAYLLACENYKPNECVMIGDDLYLDIECPKKLGLKTIWVSTKNILPKDMDTIVVKKVEDIDFNIIEKLK
jgi:putative hydrolase of the HAD superfamily